VVIYSVPRLLPLPDFMTYPFFSPLKFDRNVGSIFYRVPRVLLVRFYDISSSFYGCYFTIFVSAEITLSMREWN